VFTYMRRLIWIVRKHFSKAVVGFAIKFQGAPRMTIGSCTFVGSHEFLKLCNVSMLELKQIHQEIYDQLTTCEDIIFWHHPHNDKSDVPGLFCINNAYLDWKTKGIICRLVESYYFIQVLSLEPRGPISKKGLQEVHRIIRERTYQWLKQHSFSPKLMKCYEI